MEEKNGFLTYMAVKLLTTLTLWGNEELQFFAESIFEGFVNYWTNIGTLKLNEVLIEAKDIKRLNLREKFPTKNYRWWIAKKKHKVELQKQWIYFVFWRWFVDFNQFCWNFKKLKRCMNVTHVTVETKLSEKLYSAL